MPPEEQSQPAAEEPTAVPQPVDTQPAENPESAPPADSAAAPAPEPAPQSEPIPVTNATAGFARLLARANEVLFRRKRRKLDRIVELAAKKGQVRNNDVEKLLRVSDATATRYLAQLVREGRLKQEGSPHQPHYRQP